MYLQQRKRHLIIYNISVETDCKEVSTTLTASKLLQFLSQPEELDVKARIRVAKFCKCGVAHPYVDHQFPEDKKLNERKLKSSYVKYTF